VAINLKMEKALGLTNGPPHLPTRADE